MKKDSLLTIAEINVSYKPNITSSPSVKSSFDAYNVIRQFYSDDTIALHEQFYVIYLNRQNKVLGVYPLSKGGITSTVADPRIVISVALKCAAVGLILVHNHPSGNLQPSDCDKEMTRKIVDTCNMLDIKVLDHLI
ncbi:MAG: DNA repair protein, partial [Ferruginibacter sp.]|nr:DNA repair protein [Ferruginibacter sp.]